MSEFTSILQQHPYYQVKNVAGKPVIIFEDHRFVVAVLWLAYRCGILSAPVHLVRFDGHLDNLDFNPTIVKEYRDIQDFTQMFAFCEHQLKKEDDDWLAFALQMNLVSRALTCYEYKDLPNPNYLDRLEQIKRFDRIHDEGLDMWEQYLKSSPLVLDIDCDYFTFTWRGKIYPWSKAFYAREFSDENRSLLQRLWEQVSLVTICLESDFCGGPENSRQILNTLLTDILGDKI